MIVLRDNDLIKGIKGANAEKLREDLIAELESQREGMNIMGSAVWWNAFRSCLANVLRRQGINIPN